MVFDPRLVNGLAVLAAVVDGGNFARAAKVLGVTPSAVSRAISRLEKRLGFRVFERDPRAVRLTEEGHRLHSEIAPLLARLEDAATRTAGGATAVRGRLRVNVDAAVGQFVLPSRLAEFLAQNPELSVDFLVRDRIDDSVAADFDVAVRFGEPRPSSLTCRRLFDTRVLTCASPEYVARHGRPSDPAELASGRYECVHYLDPATSRPFRWEFRRGEDLVPVDPHGRLVVNDVQALLGACLSGHGVCQVLEIYARPMIDDGRLVQLLPEWSGERFPVYAYHRSRRLPPARVRAFIAFVVAATRQPPS